MSNVFEQLGTSCDCVCEESLSVSETMFMYICVRGNVDPWDMLL